MTICCQMSSVPFKKPHKKTDNSLKSCHRKKIIHISSGTTRVHAKLSSTTNPHQRPTALHIGLLAEAGCSYPPYPPGRLPVVAPNGLTRGDKHRAERTTSEWYRGAQSCSCCCWSHPTVGLHLWDQVFLSG